MIRGKTGVTEPVAPKEERTIHDVTCTVCGCVCDDLNITLSSKTISRFHPPCPLAADWFEKVNLAQTSPEVTARINGQPVSLELAINEAAQILQHSKSPLIWGLSRSDTKGQRAAVKLAEWLGATIDTTASVCHASSIMAIQAVGESTSSLGEIRNRADLIVYWGANPALSHPRHGERYSMEPASDWLPKGRENRTVVLVNHSQNETTTWADRYLQVEPGQDFEALWTLRLLIRGERPSGIGSTGADLSDLRELARLMTSCRYGVVFFGLDLARVPQGYLNVEALLKLVAELNSQTRFTARRLRVPGNVSGADSVLCWQTGYPFGVNLGRGFPRYNPGEYTAGEMLERKECDTCLLVGSHDVEELSPLAKQHLRKIPVIVLDPKHQQSQVNARVHFTTATCGVHHAGTVYRMDEIPLPVKAILPTKLPTDAEVLEKIFRMVRKPPLSNSR